MEESLSPELNPEDALMAQLSQDKNPEDQPKLGLKNPLLKNRRNLLLLSVLLLVMTVGSLAMYLLRPTSSEDPAEVVAAPTQAPFSVKGEVVYLTGSAWKTTVSEEKTALTEGDEIMEGDILETDADSRLVISFDEGSVLRLDSDSRADLSSLLAALMTINLEKGTVFARVQSDLDHQFRILAGDYTINSQGTAFAVENESEVKVIVFESKVKVLGENTDIEVGENQEWTRTQTQAVAVNTTTASKEFYQWSLQEEKLALVASATKAPVQKTPVEPTAAVQTAPAGTIALNAQAFEPGGVYLTWNAGLEAPEGFIVVRGLEPNPVYPGGDYKTAAAGSAQLKWGIADGKTWHFRVCRLSNGACDLYSNNVTVTAPLKPSPTPMVSQVQGITLAATKSSASSASLSWSVTSTSAMGYKIVWGLTSGPTYPNKTGENNFYQSNPNTLTHMVEGLQAGNTYFFRVCEYLNGKCGTYSNEVSLAF